MSMAGGTGKEETKRTAHGNPALFTSRSSAPKGRCKGDEEERKAIRIKVSLIRGS